MSYGARTVSSLMEAIRKCDEEDSCYDPFDLFDEVQLYYIEGYLREAQYDYCASVLSRFIDG